MSATTKHNRTQQHANMGSVALVRHQFAKLKGREDAFVATLFMHLFEIAPELRPMFPTLLVGHGRKVMTTLAFALGALDKPELLGPVARDLGARHAHYGVLVAHFDPLSRALMRTLSNALGDGFDASARAAWGSVIATLAALMSEGLERAGSEATATAHLADRTARAGAQ